MDMILSKYGKEEFLYKARSAPLFSKKCAFCLNSGLWATEVDRGVNG